MFAQKTCHYLSLCRNYKSNKWYQQSIRFCIHCRCLVCLPQASAQAFSCFGNSSTACASFLISIKRRADVMLAFFYWYILCCFGYYERKYKTNYWLAIYATHGIISSNLVLLTYRVHTLWVKKRPTIFSVHNFAKCLQIFKILSRLDSARNFQ